MNNDRRWITSVTKEAARTKIEMPWARGERRAARIARRDAMQAEGHGPRRASA